MDYFRDKHPEWDGDKARYLFFDLDGTLTDSAPGILRSAAHALRHYGIEVNDLAELNPFVGPPLEDSFKDFYGFSHEQAMEAVEIYRQRYETVGVHENAPYPGVYECLDTLRSRGYHLALATSKPERTARIVLDEFHLGGYFEFVGARDAGGVLHTKADVIRHVLAALHVDDVRQVVMIGDRWHDAAGARACGIDTVGVLFGYGNREELLGAGCSLLAESYGDLLDFFP